MDGFYKVSFSTVFGSGNGVAYLTDGQLHGGDSMMYYTGTYTHVDGVLNASLTISKHTNDTSMFSIMGIETATFEVTGEVEDGVVYGETPLPGGMVLRLTMRPIVI